MASFLVGETLPGFSAHIARAVSELCIPGLIPDLSKIIAEYAISPNMFGEEDTSHLASADIEAAVSGASDASHALAAVARLVYADTRHPENITCYGVHVPYSTYANINKVVARARPPDKLRELNIIDPSLESSWWRAGYSWELPVDLMVVIATRVRAELSKLNRPCEKVAHVIVGLTTLMNFHVRGPLLDFAPLIAIFEKNEQILANGLVALPDLSVVTGFFGVEPTYGLMH